MAKTKCFNGFSSWVFITGHRQAERNGKERGIIQLMDFILPFYQILDFLPPDLEANCAALTGSEQRFEEK